MNLSNSFMPLLDKELCQIHGGMNNGDKWKNAAIDWKAFSGAVATGAVTGGMAAAAVPSPPTIGQGIVGGALLGGAGYCITTMIDPPKTGIPHPGTQPCAPSGGVYVCQSKYSQTRQTPTGRK
jgi:hypothetical protein